MKNSDKETDTLRLNDLAELHGLAFKRVGSTYIFDDFTAHGLRQALGYAEGFDRAISMVRAVLAKVREERL